MPRADAIVPPEAIRIEDEVWQEAFTRREPARTNRRRRLDAIDGRLPDWLAEPERSEPPAEPTPRPDRAAQRPVTYAGSTVSRARPIDVEDERMSAVVEDGITTAPAAGFGAAARDEAIPTRHEVAPPARRTVKIQGRGAERHLPLPDASRRRPQRRVYERSGFRPDRVAMWAVMLGLLLVLVAVASGHG